MSKAVCLGLLCGVMLGLVSPPAVARRKPPRPTFLYVHNKAVPPEICAFEVDTDGELTPVPGSPFAVPGAGGGTGGNLRTLAFLPDRDLLFAGTVNGVAVFSVAADGALTPISGSPFGATPDGCGIAAATRGSRSFVYQADPLDDVVRGYELQPDSTLVEIPGSPFSGGNLIGVAVTGTRLAALGFLPHTLDVFDIGADGTLTPAPGSPLALPTGSVQVQGVAKTFWLPGASTADLRVILAKGSGQPAVEAAGSPFATNLVAGNAGIAIGPGKTHFVLHDVAQGVPSAQALRLGKNGKVTPLGTNQTLDLPGIIGGVIDPSGKHLLVWSDFGDEVRSYAFGKSGVLSLTDQEDVDLSLTHVSGGVVAQP